MERPTSKPQRCDGVRVRQLNSLRPEYFQRGGDVVGCAVARQPTVHPRREHDGSGDRFGQRRQGRHSEQRVAQSWSVNPTGHAQVTSAVTIHVDDSRDPRPAPFTNLTDMQLRMKMEPAEGIFLAEGEKVRYFARSMPDLCRCARRWRPNGCQASNQRWPPMTAPCTWPTRQYQSVTGYRLHRGALAAFIRKPLPTTAQVLDGARFVVVLEDLVDHTNVGLIFWTAAALGADAVLVSPQCADPLYRRSVKVSMGAVLTTPWTRPTYGLGPSRTSVRKGSNVLL